MKEEGGRAVVRSLEKKIPRVLEGKTISFPGYIKNQLMGALYHPGPLLLNTKKEYGSQVFRKRIRLANN